MVNKKVSIIIKPGGGACGLACTCGTRVERTKRPAITSVFTGHLIFNFFRFSTRIFQQIFNFYPFFSFLFYLPIFHFSSLKETKTKQSLTHKKVNQTKERVWVSSSFSRIREFFFVFVIWVFSNSPPFYLLRFSGLQSANLLYWVL